MSKIIEAIDQEQMGKEIPAFAPGDTIVVQPWSQFFFYRSQDFARRRCRASVPDLQSGRRFDRSEASR